MKRVTLYNINSEPIAILRMTPLAFNTMLAKKIAKIHLSINSVAGRLLTEIQVETIAELKDKREIYSMFVLDKASHDVLSTAFDGSEFGITSSLLANEIAYKFQNAINNY